ncbi:protein STRUBBELIG-RECEPTOR FAMILY 3 isoform X3 [Carex littledalei]|uniref:Protein STRUBBELIG-RECEPTOR FAMILY 3 isoform X3 n=1 Tax=Carex littledalei TaxID=544730 RepID=A0A833QFB2_9POAL|nr:protein STRUBBELIG-RECEPTOR FAMILY 3 isoform X3 [Carex littledalei]
MNHKRISEAKRRVYLRLVLLLVFCTDLHAAMPFFPTYTNSEDVYAINKLYSALGSPPLSGWTSLGGDPCYELWQGVQCNQFTGSIPSTLSYLTSLSDLKLSDNKLSGHLPPSIRYLRSLTTMHVQNNELSGTLEVLQNLPLKDLNIANNQFSGIVPENLLKIPNFQSEGNQLNVTVSPSPEQPPPATDGPVQQSSPPSPVYNPPLHPKRKTIDAKAIAYGVAISSSIIIAIAILLVKICIPTWKEKQNASLKRVKVIMHEQSKEPDSANNTTQSIQNNQVAILQQYTDSFSEENLIEECSFGKLYLAEDEERMLYTVLKIEERISKIPVNNFLRSVDYVSKIDHCNILRLVGYCAEYEQRLLVYRYFSKTTLNDIIYSHDSSKRTILLSWMSRIQVALQAANALEYLHEGGQNPIVHQQFAPRNILLDNDLQVCISCCGLASSLPFVSELQSYCPLALSYNAPEVNESQNWSVKSDVYSFGVVLLELLTGREPYDSTRPRAERHLARWASYQLHDIDALVKMVDPALEGRFPIRSLSRVADIISRCIQEEPEFRPSMKEIVQDLTRALNADDGSSSIF